MSIDHKAIEWIVLHVVEVVVSASPVSKSSVVANIIIIIAVIVRTNTTEQSVMLLE